MTTQTKRDWTRCAWCWRPLPAEPTRSRGMPYCDERCAGHEIRSDDDPASVIDDAQLELEA